MGLLKREVFGKDGLLPSVGLTDWLLGVAFSMAGFAGITLLPA
jgi:hypothetical protein